MSRGRFGLLLGLLTVVVAAGAFAVGVAVLDDDGPDAPPGGNKVTDVSSDSTEPSAGDAATTTTAAPADGPTWIAVVSSEGSEADAAADAEAAAAEAGVPTGVLRSDDHESLNPGLWVAYAGPYATPAEAEAAVDALDAAGIEDSYARCVGTDEQCG